MKLFNDHRRSLDAIYEHVGYNGEDRAIETSSSIRWRVVGNCLEWNDGSTELSATLLELPYVGDRITMFILEGDEAGLLFVLMNKNEYE
jgi:hypothetical protein